MTSQPDGYEVIDLEEMIERYNCLLEMSNYWINAGSTLIAYLHDELHMDYDAIYAIAEQRQAKKDLN